MNQSHFQNQIARLAETFGKNAYGTERVSLLWRAVGELPDAWLTTVVDEFIGCMRQAPLMTEFGDKIGAERERLRRAEKIQEGAESAEAMKSIFGDEEIATICKTIGHRASGAMNDDDFGAFLKGIKGASTVKPRHGFCRDEGYVFVKNDRGYEYVFRCPCEAGRSKPRAFPVWQGNPGFEVVK